MTDLSVQISEKIMNYKNPFVPIFKKEQKEHFY